MHLYKNKIDRIALTTHGFKSLFPFFIAEKALKKHKYIDFSPVIIYS